MKAVIVSAQRCGGLFLAGCLSNHPDISCPREEIFQGESIWQKRLKLTPGELLDFVLSQPYYKINACRLTYDQIFNPEIQRYIFDYGVKIIHLRRMILPTVTSTLLAKQEIERGIPRHRFDDQFEDNEVLSAGPEDVIRRIKHLLNQRKNFHLRFIGAHLDLYYEDITAQGSQLPEEQGRRICEFLQIDCAPMGARNQKMHKKPIREYYSRWPEIEQEIISAFPDLLVID